MSGAAVVATAGMAGVDQRQLGETATITLSAYVYFDGRGAGDFGDRLILLGELVPLGEGKGKRGIMVPVGNGVKGVSIPVQPGRYLCEIALPSGDVARAETVAVAGEETPVVINADKSPHESHSWQYLIGGIEESDVYYRTRRLHPTVRPEVRWYTSSWDRSAWEIERERLPSWDGDDPSWKPVEPTDEGEGTFLYRFMADGPINGSVAGEGRRRFCAVRTVRGEFLVTVPTPWFDADPDPDSGVERPVEMLVKPAAPDGHSPISVTVRDPRLGGGLAYFASGSLDLARIMFVNSEQLLQSKMANPIAAAAGAYVLVGTDSRSGEPAWYRWVENLSNWQDWLPDGKILAATRQFRSAETETQRADAKAAFLDAFASGVPVYTIGLRWLIDGLSRVPRDSDVESAIDKVRAYSYRIDMNQPFVVARLDKEAW